MNSQQLQFLNLRHIPARLTMEEAGWLLGFAPHSLPVLVAAGLLKPLGQPASNAGKYFATTVLYELKQDANWLARATKQISMDWQMKNQRKGGGPAHIDGGQ